MKNEILGFLVTMVCIIGLLSIGALFMGVRSIQAQEANPGYPKTRSWTIHESGVKVYIIDTAGVCLYAVESGGKFGGYAIAAVSKHEIAYGLGCQ